MLSFLKEFITFLKHRKKMWMLPMVAIIVAMGTLLIAAQGSVIAPFIYALF